MLLQLQNLSFGFTPRKPLFKDLPLALEQSKIYALMGANAEGRTSQRRLLLVPKLQLGNPERKL